MNRKEFFYPSFIKIIIFLIFVILFVFLFLLWSGPPAFWMIMLAYVVTPFFYSVKTAAVYPLIADFIYWYLVACIIDFIYKKIKK
jgi:hypothetical protein